MSQYLDPWRCGHCGKLIYAQLIEPDGHPVPAEASAPEPKRFVTGYGDVCQTCADLYEVVNDRGYFRALHAEWEKLNEGKSRLRPGQDYFK